MSGQKRHLARDAKIVTGFLLAGGIALQAQAIPYLAHIPVQTFAFLASHLSGALLATFALHRIFIGKRYGDGRALWLLILGMALLMPVAGGLMALATLFMLASKRHATPAPGHVVWEARGEHWLPGHSVTKELEALKPFDDEPITLTRIHRKKSPYHTAEELLRKLHSTSAVTRREAVLGISQLRQEHAVTILKTVLEDEDEQVRLMAKAALRRICERHDTIIEGFRETLQRDPENPFHHLLLAETYFSLSELDAENDASIASAHKAKAESFIALAKTRRDAMAKQDPELAQELTIRLLRRSLALGRLGPAGQYAQELVGAGVEDPRLHDALIELAYETKNWARMKELLLALPPAPVASPVIRETARNWLHENA